MSTPECLDILYRDRHRVFIAKRPEGSHPIGDVRYENFSAFLAEVLIPVIARGNARQGLQMLVPSFNRQLHSFLQNTHGKASPVSLKYMISFALFSSTMTSFFGDSFPLDTYEDIVLVDEYAYYLLFPPLSVFAFSARRARRRARARLLEFMDP